MPDSLETYNGGIYEDTTGDLNIVHDISVVGFGVENGVKYWVVRNSWGTHWGENGFFRVIRGTNNIAIESDCSWAVPKDTWNSPLVHKTTDEEKNDERNKKYSVNGPYPVQTGAFLEKNQRCSRVAETELKTKNKLPSP